MSTVGVQKVHGKRSGFYVQALTGLPMMTRDVLVLQRDVGLGSWSEA